MTAGSPPNERRQSPSLRITTCQPAGVSSATVKSRPIDGFTPSVRKKFAVTRMPGRRSASPSASSVGTQERTSVISSKPRLRLRQSMKVA